MSISITREVANSIADVIANDSTRIPDSFLIGAFNTNYALRYPLGIAHGGKELELAFSLFSTSKNIPQLTYVVAVHDGPAVALGFTVHWSKEAGAVAARRAAAAAVRRAATLGVASVTVNARDYVG